MLTLYMRVERLIMLVIIPQLFTLTGFKQKTMYGNNPAAGRYYTVNGIKLYVEVYGTGQPLLMTHGNGGDMSAFAGNVPYFAKKYQVILVDTRAHGKSVDKGAKLTFDQIADDFAALLDVMHIKKAYVLGWSDGGINALLMAIRHTDKVIKLASTGANITPDATAFSPASWQGASKYHNENKNRVWRTDKQKNDWKIFMLDWDQPNIKLTQLQQIKCPAFIIAGDHDVISDAHTRLIQKNIPNSTLWIIPNSGHATLIEHAVEFNKRVGAFFDRK